MSCCLSRFAPFLVLFALLLLDVIVAKNGKPSKLYWNISSSIFNNNNMDRVIEINEGNSQFYYDQVDIICPVYATDTHDENQEMYIIYLVSKNEYDTCRVNNSDIHIIAICDKPQKPIYVTITFRLFSPQPNGLEFLPGNDYYFISTSSKDDLHQQFGGWCSSHNMKLVLRVCCLPEEQKPNINTEQTYDKAPEEVVKSVELSASIKNSLSRIYWFIYFAIALLWYTVCDM